MKKNPLDDPQNQEKINHFLIEHAPLINLHFKKLMDAGHIPKESDPSDLHMAGFEGLMDALHKYDPKVGSSFSNYAGHRIRGKMLDFAHSNYADHIPKTERIQAKKLASMTQTPTVAAPAAPATAPATMPPKKPT